MGIRLTFIRTIQDGKETFLETPRVKDSQAAGEMYISKGLHSKAKTDAIAVMNNHLERQRKNKKDE